MPTFLHHIRPTHPAPTLNEWGGICVRASNAGEIEAFRMLGREGEALLGSNGATSLRGVVTYLKGWARVPAMAVITALTLSTPLAAQALIRCPDWKSLLEEERIYGLRTSAPAQSFETAIKATTQTQTVSAPWNPFTKKVAGVEASKVGVTTCAPHTVKSGDTLSRIAKARLGSDKRFPELAAANKIKVSTPLKIGQILQIPCTPGNTGGAALAKKSSQVSSKIAAPTPPVAPLPVWKAKSGEYLTDTLRRWGKSAGYKIIKEGNDDWRVSVPVSVQGTFEEAIAQLVRGFEGTGRPPGISIYSNKVVKIGAP